MDTKRVVPSCRNARVAMRIERQIQYNRYGIFELQYTVPTRFYSLLIIQEIYGVSILPYYTINLGEKNSMCFTLFSVRRIIKKV